MRQSQDRRGLAVQDREARGRQRIVLPAGQTFGCIVDDTALDERHEIGIADDAQDHVLERRLLAGPVIGHRLELELLIERAVGDVVRARRRQVLGQPGARPGILGRRVLLHLDGIDDGELLEFHRGQRHRNGRRHAVAVGEGDLDRQRIDRLDLLRLEDAGDARLVLAVADDPDQALEAVAHVLGRHRVAGAVEFHARPQLEGDDGTLDLPRLRELRHDLDRVGQQRSVRLLVELDLHQPLVDVDADLLVLLAADVGGIETGDVGGNGVDQRLCQRGPAEAGRGNQRGGGQPHDQAREKAAFYRHVKVLSLQRRPRVAGDRRMEGVPRRR